MTDALKVLPHDAEKRVELALAALRHIYPGWILQAISAATRSA